MPRVYARKLRVAAELQRLLNELLRNEVRDPRLTGLHVNEVDLSGDLSVARVYFSLLQPDEDPRPAQQALAKAAGFMRSRLGRELHIRHVPELRFTYDESVRRGIALTHLIEDAVGDRDPADSEE